MSGPVSVTPLTAVSVRLFVVMDPAGTMRISPDLSSGRSAATAPGAAWEAVTVSFGVVVAFAFLGRRILHLHSSLPALQRTGELLLLLVALELLTGKEKAATPAHDAVRMLMAGEGPA
jgi:multiple antibiotic resistance protein